MMYMIEEKAYVNNGIKRSAFEYALTFRVSLETKDVARDTVLHRLMSCVSVLLCPGN